jgi:hypothetical protein
VGAKFSQKAVHKAENLLCRLKVSKLRIIPELCLTIAVEGDVVQM